MRALILLSLTALTSTTAFAAAPSASATVSNIRVEVDGASSGFYNEAMVASGTVAVRAWPDAYHNSNILLGPNQSNQLSYSNPNSGTVSSSAILENNSATLTSFAKSNQLDVITESGMMLSSTFAYKANTLVTVSIDIDLLTDYEYGNYAHPLVDLSFWATEVKGAESWGGGSIYEGLVWGGERALSTTRTLSYYGTADTTMGIFLRTQVTSSFNTIPPAVPEPSAYAMLGLGLGFLGVAARRRKYN